MIALKLLRSIEWMKSHKKFFKSKKLTTVIASNLFFY